MLGTCAIATPLLCHGSGWRIVTLTTRSGCLLFYVMVRGAPMCMQASWYGFRCLLIHLPTPINYLLIYIYFSLFLNFSFLSIYLSISQFIFLSIYSLYIQFLSTIIPVFVELSVTFFLCCSISKDNCLSTYLLIYQSTYLDLLVCPCASISMSSSSSISVYLFIRLSLCSFICLFIRLSLSGKLCTDVFIYFFVFLCHVFGLLPVQQNWNSIYQFTFTYYLPVCLHISWFIFPYAGVVSPCVITFPRLFHVFISSCIFLLFFFS